MGARKIIYVTSFAAFGLVWIMYIHWTQAPELIPAPVVDEQPHSILAVKEPEIVNIPAKHPVTTAVAAAKAEPELHQTETKHSALKPKTALNVSPSTDPLTLLSCLDKWPEIQSKWTDWLKQPHPDYSQPPPGKFKEIPSVMLWVRTFTPGAHKLLTLLFETYELFWPIGFGGFTVVLDDESPLDHEFAKLLVRSPPYPTIAFEPMPPNETFPGRVCGRSQGYDRQMYSTFHADLYTDAEYIAVIDNDSLFTTVVTPEAFFENGKPVVIGKHTVILPNGKIWAPRDGPQNGRWAEATQTALGKPQMADFMYNFPVLIRRDTFRLSREYIMAQHNSSFEEAFRVIASEKRSYCQINILLNYAWYFQRDLYSWHIQSTTRSDGEWITGKWNKPMPRVAMHARGWSNDMLQGFIIQGYCYSCLHLQNCMAMEKEKAVSKYLGWHHNVILSWDALGYVWQEKREGENGDPAKVQEKHYANVKATKHTWPPSLAVIFSRSVGWYVDCSKTTDDKNCRNAQNIAHRQVEQRRKQMVFPKHLPTVIAHCRMVYKNASAEQ